LAQIRIRVARHAAFYSPLLATIGAGFLAAEGLEPTYTIATPENTVPGGLGDGTTHVGQLAVSASWDLLEQGRTPHFMHFAQINERDGFFLLSREPDPDFRWEKLCAKRVLVDHLGQPLAMFKYAAQKMGVDFADIEAVDAGEPNEMDAAFRGGEGDYIHQQGPAPQQLARDGIGQVVAAVGEVIGPVAFSSLVATPEWLASDMAAAFMRAYRNGRRYVNETPPAEIAAAERDFFPGIDEDVLGESIGIYQSLGCWNPDVQISRPCYDAALTVFQTSGGIKHDHPYESVVAAPPDV
jgi:NitT/TauT family transport system substrate-binding protein